MPFSSARFYGSPVKRKELGGPSMRSRLARSALKRNKQPVKITCGAVVLSTRCREYEKDSMIRAEIGEKAKKSPERDALPGKWDGGLRPKRDTLFDAHHLPNPENVAPEGTRIQQDET